MSKITYKLSPSSCVEQYYAHNCDRFLLYQGLGKKERIILGFEKPSGSGSEIAAAAGNRWERQIAQRLIEADSLVYKIKETDEGEQGFGSFEAEETLKVLKDTVERVWSDHKKRYLYQGTLIATDTFLKEFFCFDKSLYDGTDDSLFVKISNTHPDFISVAWDDELNAAIISVVDAKLAKKMKVEHKVQVTLYVRLITHSIKEYNSRVSDDEKINAVINNKYGYLWNYGKDVEDSFPLGEVDTALDDFTVNVLPSVVMRLKYAIEKDEKIGTDVCSLNTRVSRGCEYCENYYQCMRGLKAIGSYRLLPYLSGYAQEYAEKLGMPESLVAFLERAETPEVREDLNGSRSWNYLFHEGTLIDIHKGIAPYAFNARKNRGHKWRGVRSYTMSSWQDITMLLTAHKDVGTDRVYALGYYAVKRVEGEDDVVSTGTFIARDRGEAAYLCNATEFVRSLYDYLSEIDRANRTGESLSLQSFVMDGYEKNNLEEVLYDLADRDMDEQDLAVMVQELMFWMQGDRLVTESENQPETVSPGSIVVISNELKKLISFPEPVVYGIRNVVRDFKVWAEKEMFLDRDDKKYFGRISDMIPPDIINEIWDSSEEGHFDKAAFDGFICHLKKRLYTEYRILRKLQYEGSGSGERQSVRYLTGKTERFSLPAPVNFNNAYLRKWYLESNLEELLQYNSIRNARLQELDAAVDTGSILRLQFVGTTIVENGRYENTYHVFKVLNPDGMIQDKPWLFGLLAVNTPDGIEKMHRFSDWEKKDIFSNIAADDTSLMSMNFIDVSRTNDGEIRITGQLYINRGKKEDDIELNDRSEYLLSNRYVDINNPKVISILETLDAGDFNPELIDPTELNGDVPEEQYFDATEDVLRFSHMDGYGFTDSQSRAFRNLCTRKLTVLQGPPGTGKTDFIARANVTICRYSMQVRRTPISVLISANSHAAIENAMLAINAKIKASRSQGDTRDDIRLLKADRLETCEALEDIGVISSKYMGGNVNAVKENGKSVIVGATNWACDKFLEDLSFDIVVIDEASQVRVMDAMLSLNAGNTDYTRYLLVGDDDQLPPIIGGSYVRNPDRPYLYGSIFRFYRDIAMANNMDCCKMLEEDFRMNDTLVRYSAEKIYGDNYKAFNKEIATRHLDYAGGDVLLADADDELKAFVRYVLDNLAYNEVSYWPLVFCCIKNGNAGLQRRLERYLVTELTYVLRRAIGNGLDDNAFWMGDGENDGRLGIISPHHEHIEKLKDEIAGRTGMNREGLFVGTVDKLQGQQRDAVIVSYGVADIETAVGEKEFIYSRNRLNVSLTRAKSKSIVFLSEILTRRPVEMLSTDDEDVQKGMEFVCDFLPYMMREDADMQVSSRDFSFKIGEREITVEVYRKKIVPGTEI